MGRRRFEHLVLEISLAAGTTIPRYRLWLRIADLGFDPEQLSRGEVLSFCEGPLAIFLAESGIRIAPRDIRRLRKAVSRFDPDLLSPYEQAAAS